jgi:hypothetical protein
LQRIRDPRRGGRKSERRDISQDITLSLLFLSAKSEVGPHVNARASIFNGTHLA